MLKLETFFSLNGRNNSPKIENFDRKRGFGKPEILCFPPFLSPFPYFWVPKVRENEKRRAKSHFFGQNFQFLQLINGGFIDYGIEMNTKQK